MAEMQTVNFFKTKFIPFQHLSNDHYPNFIACFPLSWAMNGVFESKISGIHNLKDAHSNHTFTETRAPRGTDRSPKYNEHFC